MIDWFGNWKNNNQNNHDSLTYNFKGHASVTKSGISPSHSFTSNIISYPLLYPTNVPTWMHTTCVLTTIPHFYTPFAYSLSYHTCASTIIPHLLTHHCTLLAYSPSYATGVPHLYPTIVLHLLPILPHLYIFHHIPLVYKPLRPPLFIIKLFSDVLVFNSSTLLYHKFDKK